MILCACLEERYASRAKDSNVFLQEPVRPLILHEHYSRCDIWFTSPVSMGGPGTLPFIQAWCVGSISKVWIDIWMKLSSLKAFQAFFLIYSFYVQVSSHALVEIRMVDLFFLVGIKKPCLTTMPVIQKRSEQWRLAASTLHLIRTNQFFYNRSGCWTVMSTAALVINGTWQCQLAPWLRKEAASSFVVKNSAGEGA